MNLLAFLMPPPEPTPLSLAWKRRVALVTVLTLAERAREAEAIKPVSSDTLRFAARETGRGYRPRRAA